MKDDRLRETSYINCEFTKAHADKLLQYHTYLMYSFKVKLNSKSSYKAINYFLDSIDTKVSDKFFSSIDAKVRAETVDEYNKFIANYIRKTNSDIRAIETYWISDVHLPQLHEDKNEKITLEYFDNVKCPYKSPFLTKVAGKLNIDENDLTVEMLDKIDFLF